jgi:hypothetical protein
MKTIRSKVVARSAFLIWLAAVSVARSAFASDFGPCYCPNCPGSTEFTVSTNAFGGRHISFTNGAQSSSVDVASNSKQSVGSVGICIRPCSGTWGATTECTDVCCKCGPC